MRTHLQRATAIMAASGGIALALAGCQVTTQTTPIGQPVKGLATCSLAISDTEIDEEALLVRAALSSYTDQLVATQESTRATATTATHTLVDDGCQLIILSGSNIDQQSEALAEEFDQTKFVLVDAQDYHNVSEAEPTQHALNLRTIVFNTLHPSYVAGYLAAGMTSTGTIGVYADEPTDASMLAMDGFASGVLAYNLAKGSNVALAGWDATTSTPALSPDSASSGELAGRQSRQSSANDASPSVDEAAHTTVTSLLEQGADIACPSAREPAHTKLLRCLPRMNPCTPSDLVLIGRPRMHLLLTMFKALCLLPLAPSRQCLAMLRCRVTPQSTEFLL